MAERQAPDIRIFVSCHKAFPVPEGGLLYPVHVGAALADQRLDGYIRDDSGENISRLNRRYCEMTGQYWAWKNADADYYGFFHYRRYLYPDTRCRRPYIIRSEPDGALLEKLGYGTFAGLIGRRFSTTAAGCSRSCGSSTRPPTSAAIIRRSCG